MFMPVDVARLCCEGPQALERRFGLSQKKCVTQKKSSATRNFCYAGAEQMHWLTGIAWKNKKISSALSLPCPCQGPRQALRKCSLASDPKRCVRYIIIVSQDFCDKPQQAAGQCGCEL